MALVRARQAHLATAKETKVNFKRKQQPLPLTMMQNAGPTALHPARNRTSNVE